MLLILGVILILEMLYEKIGILEFIKCVNYNYFVWKNSKIRNIVCKS